MDDHWGPLAVHGVLAGFVKVKLGQEIGLPAYFEPVIAGKLHLDLVLVAIVDHLQIHGLILELQLRDRHFFRLRDIDRTLHPSGIAVAIPMTRTVRPFFIRELGIAFLVGPAGQVHVVMLMLFGFLRELRCLTGGRGRMGED